MPIIGWSAHSARRAGDAKRSRVLLGSALALGLVLETALATAPLIDHIELLGTNLVTIHVYTEAGRTYTLQYAVAVNSGSWSNLYVIPAEPFPNHYVLADYLTNSCRFYRLTVTP